MLRISALLLSLTLVACATQLGVREKSDLRRQMFSQIVFAPDYDSRRADFLAKWASPLRISLKDRDSESIDKYKSTVITQIGILARITGLDLALATENNPANITIHFDTSDGLQKLARTSTAKAEIAASGCSASISKDASHRITTARLLILINPDAQEINLMSGTLNSALARNEINRFTHCLIKGLIQILGFVNPSDVITPSIFNSSKNLSHPTSVDLKMIKTLYDASLKPGMPRREALLAAEKLLQ